MEPTAPAERLKFILASLATATGEVEAVAADLRLLADEPFMQAVSSADGGGAAIRTLNEAQAAYDQLGARLLALSEEVVDRTGKLAGIDPATV